MARKIKNLNTSVYMKMFDPIFLKYFKMNFTDNTFNIVFISILVYKNSLTNNVRIES